MNLMQIVRPSCVAAALACSAGLAQVPTEIAESLKSIGPVVAVPATARLYAGRGFESEPYTGINVERDIRYGTDERHVLDVFTPSSVAAQPLPVLVYVPGGGYVNAARRVPNSPFFDNVMVWAVRNGMVGISMNYRVAPKDPWPAGAEDVARAMRWIKENVQSRGGDPKHVFLFGHSSGAAHVASYVADQRFHDVDGAGLAGALMLSGFYRVTPETQQGPRRVYFGEDAAKYEEMSAQGGLIAMSTRVPLWIGFAELDPPETVDQAQGLHDALCRADRCRAFVKFPGHSHMSEMFSIGSDDQSVSGSVLEFVRSH